MLVGGGFFAARQVYFLGTDEGGRLALYQGLALRPCRSTSSSTPRCTSSPTLVASLPEDRRDEAAGHDLRSRDDAGLISSTTSSSRPASATEETTTQTGGNGGDATNNGTGQQQQQQQGSDNKPKDGGGDGGREDGGRKFPAAGRFSARNRELFALIPVALLVSAGFAAVFAVRADEIGTLSLTYGGYFLAICVATHFFLRITLPNADPYLFPLCAVLAAVGLVMLYRIEESLAVEQATFFLLWPGRVRGDDRLPARLPQARALPLPDRGRLDRVAVGAAIARGRISGERRVPCHRPGRGSPSSPPSWGRSASSSSTRAI